MFKTIGLFTLGVVFATRLSYADEPPPVESAMPMSVVPKSPKDLYPASLVERPLILPRLLFEPSVGVQVANLEVRRSGGVIRGTGESVSAALDIGLSRRLQLGVIVEVPVHPNPDFGIVDLNLEIGLIRNLMNLRFDLGIERIVVASTRGDITIFFSETAFIWGVGLPIKLKLNRRFAITSGTTTARGFGIQPSVSPSLVLRARTAACSVKIFSR